MNFNPFKKKKLPIGRVFVGVDQTSPHVGLSLFSEKKIEGASFCVDGITIEQARIDLCGKVINWALIAPKQLTAVAAGKSTVSLDVFKSLFK